MRLIEEPSGGNIPPNTIASFDIALKEGADILEMDLFKSIDGEIFVFHTGMETGSIGSTYKS